MPDSLLRVLACGSVDDGKSTLIGRLLFECGTIPDDVMAALERDSKRFGTVEGGTDYALLVDGLAAERDQGITIDVAYRFFETPRRRFILADAPGHEQYTRNMVTGASASDLAVLLVDARKGLLVQTRRHAAIASLLGIRQVVLAVNKMDLVGFEQAVFDKIVTDFYALLGKLGPLAVTAIPVCARDGDNVTAPSTRMPWYSGTTLLTALEGAEPTSHVAERAFRMPVQLVARPDHTFRGYAGTVATGTIRPGAAVVNAMSGIEAKVARIVTMDGDLAEAVAGPGGDAGAGSRDRRLARRRAGGGAAAGAGGPGDRLGGVDGRDAAVPRPRLSGHARLAHRDRDDHRDHQPAGCRYAGRGAGARTGAERDRPGDDFAGAARAVRALCGQPRTGRLHPDRPADAQHGRRRHGDRPARRCEQHPLASAGRGQARRAPG